MAISYYEACIDFDISLLTASDNSRRVENEESEEDDDDSEDGEGDDSHGEGGGDGDGDEDSLGRGRSGSSSDESGADSEESDDVSAYGEDIGGCGTKRLGDHGPDKGDPRGEKRRRVREDTVSDPSFVSGL